MPAPPRRTPRQPAAPESAWHPIRADREGRGNRSRPGQAIPERQQPGQFPRALAAPARAATAGTPPTRHPVATRLAAPLWPLAPSAANSSPLFGPSRPLPRPFSAATRCSRRHGEHPANPPPLNPPGSQSGQIGRAVGTSAALVNTSQERQQPGQFPRALLPRPALPLRPASPPTRHPARPDAPPGEQRRRWPGQRVSLWSGREPPPPGWPRLRYPLAPPAATPFPLFGPSRPLPRPFSAAAR